MNTRGFWGRSINLNSDLQGKKADLGSLFFIFISGGDFYSICNSDTPNNAADVADRVLANISTAVTRLAELGAKRFMVVNSRNLSIDPFTVECNIANQALVFQNSINTKLPGEMKDLEKQLQINIEIFDYPAISDRILSNPDQYGLKNMSGPCLSFTPDGIANGVCSSPDEFYFWDKCIQRKV